MNINPVTIIVPVYGDWPSLDACIAALRQHVNTDVHKVMLVNDCGPEVDTIESNIINAIQGAANFFYFRNEQNLGFIGTCNRSVMNLDVTDNDILLLNSDTKVTRGFLDEMITTLCSDKKIGAVSPRSNNATIATIPLSAAHQKGIESEESYGLYKKMQPMLPRITKIPVAHGFCMLIRRSLIKEYGLFDPIFGKGYGEEVDFCMRIKSHGFSCALSNWAYVFHLEARSFSLETKAKLLEVNNKIIWERHPDYRQSVRDYMDKAIDREKKIEDSALGNKTKTTLKSNVRKLIKRNKYIHKIARRLRHLRG